MYRSMARVSANCALSAITTRCSGWGERAVPSESSFLGTQRINGATEGDPYKKPVCTRNGYGREVVWEYPRPIIAPVNRRYRSDDAPPSFVAGERDTPRPSILITVSRPGEWACLIPRKPASVSSILSPSYWTTESRAAARTSRSMGEDAGTTDGAFGASLAGIERSGLDRRVKSASS